MESLWSISEPEGMMVKRGFKAKKKSKCDIMQGLGQHAMLLMYTMMYSTSPIFMVSFM